MEGELGLDMYLEGRKSVSNRWDEEDKQVKEDGFVVKDKTLDLGYWRKHPNLHGYIVKNFADCGEDNCRPVYLYEDALVKIIETIEKDELPTDVTGFFFGKSYVPGEKDEYYSYEQQKEDDLKIFRSALDWMNAAPHGEWRDVRYQASW